MDLLQTLGILVGVVSGIAGLVLGILNYLHQRDTSRPRLRVRPRIMHLVDRDPNVGRDMTEKNVGVMEICNVGNVPVIGGNIGFLPKRKQEMGFLIVAPESLSGERWPCQIQPGQMIMLRMKLDNLVEPSNIGELGQAFVSTAVGDSFHASRRDMKRFRESLNSAASDLLKQSEDSN